MSDAPLYGRAGVGSEGSATTPHLLALPECLSQYALLKMRRPEVDEPVFWSTFGVDTFSQPAGGTATTSQKCEADSRLIDLCITQL